MAHTSARAGGRSSALTPQPVSQQLAALCWAVWPADAGPAAALKRAVALAVLEYAARDIDAAPDITRAQQRGPAGAGGAGRVRLVATVAGGAAAKAWRRLLAERAGKGGGGGSNLTLDGFTYKSLKWLLSLPDAGAGAADAGGGSGGGGGSPLEYAEGATGAAQLDLSRLLAGEG